MNRATHNQASITSMDLSGPVCRLAYVCYLGVVALCSVLAFIGVLRADSVCLIAALVAGVVALILRFVLRRFPSGLESEGEVGDDFCVTSASSEVNCAVGVQPKAGELAALLQEWDGLERARGSRRFDPWALQAVRSEIRATVQENDTLRRLLGPGS